MNSFLHCDAATFRFSQMISGSSLQNLAHVDIIVTSHPGSDLLHAFLKQWKAKHRFEFASSETSKNFTQGQTCLEMNSLNSTSASLCCVFIAPKVLVPLWTLSWLSFLFPCWLSSLSYSISSLIAQMLAFSCIALWLLFSPGEMVIHLLSELLWFIQGSPCQFLWALSSLGNVPFCTFCAEWPVLPRHCWTCPGTTWIK